MKAPIEWYKGKGEGGGRGVERVLCHRCKNSILFPKYEEVQHGWHQRDSLKNTFLHKFQQKNKICTYRLSGRAGWKIYGSRS